MRDDLHIEEGQKYDVRVLEGGILVLTPKQGRATTALSQLREALLSKGASLEDMLNDAKILAAAEECLADVLITHDKQHFLGNPMISPPDTHCRVKTASEALAWCLQTLLTEDEKPETQ